MIAWYNDWIKDSNKFFAYIYSNKETEPIGEVYYYPENGTHYVGILIKEGYRGKGYSYEVLKELEKIAFEKNNINELVDTVPENRISAIKALKKAGFIDAEKETTIKIFNTDTVIKQLRITKEEFKQNKKD